MPPQRNSWVHLRSTTAHVQMMTPSLCRAVGTCDSLSQRVEVLFIVRGSPWQNGYAESFHGKLRDELLNAELFADLREAKALAAAWRNDYNHHRPHSALGYQAPAAYAAPCESAAADAALGAPPQTPPGALPLDPGFFPSTERGALELETEDLTLITAGT